MADRPILFSAPMVRALLDGQKTQTRRLLPLGSPPKDSGKHVVKQLIRPFDAPAFYQHEWRSKYGVFCGVVKLRFAVGDRLYVREHWRAEARLDKKAPRDINTNYPGVKYIATDEPDDFGIEGKFRQGMHMPRWASRLTLIVKDVRVERLQDISERDAIAEGIEPLHLTSGLCAWKCYGGTGEQDAWASPIESYRTLWDHINGKGAWDENPWVSAISFGVLKQNIDEVL